MKMTMNVMLASLASVLVLVLAGAARAQGGGSAPAGTAPAQAQPTGEKPTTPSTTGQPKRDDKGAAKPEETKPVPTETESAYVKMSTSKGDVFIELNAKKAPISTANFLSYVDKKYYDGTVFHRVIPKFMVQGGGYQVDGKGEMKEKPGLDAPIKNEWQNGLKNARGTVAMARTADHNSATSQFFVNVADNSFLDQPRDGAGYAVFGKVVAGMSTVDKIEGVKTTAKGMYQNCPVEPVTITSITRTTKDEADKAAAAEKK